MQITKSLLAAVLMFGPAVLAAPADTTGAQLAEREPLPEDKGVSDDEFRRRHRHRYHDYGYGYRGWKRQDDDGDDSDDSGDRLAEREALPEDEHNHRKYHSWEYRQDDNGDDSDDDGDNSKRDLDARQDDNGDDDDTGDLSARQDDDGGDDDNDMVARDLESRQRGRGGGGGRGGGRGGRGGGGRGDRGRGGRGDRGRGGRGRGGRGRGGYGGYKRDETSANTATAGDLENDDDGQQYDDQMRTAQYGPWGRGPYGWGGPFGRGPWGRGW